MVAKLMNVLKIMIASALLIGGVGCAKKFVDSPCPLPAKRPILTSIKQDLNDDTKEKGYWMNDPDLRSLSVYGAYNEVVRDELLKKQGGK